MPHRELQKQINSVDEIGFAVNWLRAMAEKGIQRGAVLVTVTRPRRSLDANAKLWAMLTDVARQCRLVINGERVWAQPADWKDVFSAALTREQRMAQGIDGAEHEVVWGEKARATFAEYREVAEV